MNLLESFFQTSISYEEDELKNYKIWNSKIKDGYILCYFEGLR
jgi:hypothetical protein